MLAMTSLAFLHIPMHLTHNMTFISERITCNINLFVTSLTERLPRMFSNLLQVFLRILECLLDGLGQWVETLAHRFQPRKALACGRAGLVHGVYLDTMTTACNMQIPIPRRPHEGGLSVVAGIPCANAKLEPAFGVHGEADAP